MTQFKLDPTIGMDDDEAELYRMLQAEAAEQLAAEAADKLAAELAATPTDTRHVVPMFAACSPANTKTTAEAIAATCNGRVKSSVSHGDLPRLFTVMVPDWEAVKVMTGSGGKTADSSLIELFKLLKNVADEAGLTAAMQKFDPKFIVPGTVPGLVGGHFGSNHSKRWGQSLRGRIANAAADAGGIMLLPVNPFVANYFGSRSTKSSVKVSIAEPIEL